MNIEHARTFLAVADTGSFVSAAERLHVTQSTVSARIRALEDLLGRPLFTRNKAGAVLTTRASISSFMLGRWCGRWNRRGLRRKS